MTQPAWTGERKGDEGRPVFLGKGAAWDPSGPIEIVFEKGALPARCSFERYELASFVFGGVEMTRVKEFNDSAFWLEVEIGNPDFRAYCDEFNAIWDVKLFARKIAKAAALALGKSGMAKVGHALLAMESLSLFDRLEEELERSAIEACGLGQACKEKSK